MNKFKCYKCIGTGVTPIVEGIGRIWLMPCPSCDSKNPLKHVPIGEAMWETMDQRTNKSSKSSKSNKLNTSKNKNNSQRRNFLNKSV